MADSTLAGLTEDTSPGSDSLLYTVDDPGGTPADRKATAGNLITKGHGLSDGIVKVATGVMANAASGTDYAPATSGSAILKGNGSGGFSNASAGTDYYNPGGTDVAVADGGTGASTKTAAFDALSPMSASGDIIYGGASGTGTRLAKGTDGNVLTLASGLPSWAAATSGGQSLVTRVVAVSGGDHTTLGAAITAASAGDTIFVKPGTYTESAITCALNNISIIALQPEQTLLTFSTNTATFSGTGVRIEGIGMTFSTGQLTMSGANSEIINCHLAKTGNTGNLYLCSATTNHFIGNRVICTNTSANDTLVRWSVTGNHRIANNYFELQPFAGNLGIQIQSTESIFSNNIVLATGGTNAGNTLYSHSGTFATIVGNYFEGSNNYETFSASGSTSTITGNVITNSRTYGLQVSGVRSMVSGNRVRTGSNNNSTNGIYIDASEVVISGNGVEGHGANAGSGIYVESSRDRVTISGNRVEAYGTGITVSASSCDNTMIVGNNLETFNASGAAIVDSGTATTIKNNVGVSPLFEKEFVRMKNSSGGSLAVGDLVVWKATAAGDEVNTTTTSGDDKVFGMATATIADTAYGYFQTLGKTTALKANGTTDIAIGDFLTAFTTAKVVAKAAAGDQCIAIALEAYTADDSSGVIDALLIRPRMI